MKAHSHIQFGKYLLRILAPELPQRYCRAFLFGSIEPDFNYATYFRGFIHHERMRGHNFPNAERCIARLCKRLQLRDVEGMMAWFRLGKLVHYTADAFTHAHNACFGGNLREHRDYEMQLQACFLQALDEDALRQKLNCGSVMDMIRAEHEHYLRQPVCPETDVQYVLRTVRLAFETLTPSPMPA